MKTARLSVLDNAGVDLCAGVALPALAKRKVRFMPLDHLSRSVYTEDHEAFRDTVRRFVADEIEPNAAK